MERIFLSVEVVTLIFLYVDRRYSVPPRSMQRDQESKAHGENDERNEEVTVGENGAKFFNFGHGVFLPPVGATIKRRADGCQPHRWYGHSLPGLKVETWGTLVFNDA